ncbi:hypothetical protein BXZ70DRAFT_773209 [Cristinia sonorae]|uniref:Uncharacterized protein n=1 Tax=Cristinia sonorae TaxID=1940300 RepID=A0A8K0UTW4_9AGAR|nr:hypothetical protein BXZ70DRAFT_773209 [Cristinia sonorae]
MGKAQRIKSLEDAALFLTKATHSTSVHSSALNSIFLIHLSVTMHAAFLTSLVLAATAHAAPLFIDLFPFGLLDGPNGGNAVTGDTGNSDGGSVSNTGNVIVGSQEMNQAGSGGLTQSGAATGGNTKRQLFGLFDPFASSGGSATTGSTGDSNGGGVTNDGNAIVSSIVANKAGNGGNTLSGAATGGEGSWFWGNGGDGTSGNTGSTNGGSIDNNGNVIYGSAVSNQAGSGGTSQSGTATGGNAKRQLFGLFDPFASSGGSATTGTTGDSNGGDVTNGGNAIVSSIVASE